MQTSSNVVVCFGMTWKQSAITFTKVLLKNFGYLNKEYYKKLKVVDCQMQSVLWKQEKEELDNIRKTCRLDEMSSGSSQLHVV